jgi:hypothetical protein
LSILRSGSLSKGIFHGRESSFDDGIISAQGLSELSIREIARDIRRFRNAYRATVLLADGKGV